VTGEARSEDKSVVQAVSRRWLAALSDGSNEVIALFSGGARLLYVSVGTPVVEISGLDAAELGKQASLDLIHPEDVKRVSDAFRAVASAHGARQTVEYRFRHHHGHYIRVQSTAVNHLGDEVVRAIVVHTRSASVSDVPVSGDEPTSQVKDRIAFSEQISLAIQRSRAEADYGFSVLILELERLKMLVGSYGQDVVELLLTEVGKRLAQLLRPQDTLARLGGGEFAILLDGVLDRRQAGRVADRIQKTVGMRYHLGQHTINPSGIVGIATSERDYAKAEHVLRDAAAAANRARNRGRKRRAVFQTQMRVEDTQWMSLVSEMHNALAAKQFKVYYQPIVSLGTRTLTGFEALLRWEHPKQGMISPNQFIPIAEETGLINQIGKWVLRESCQQMATWASKFELDPPLNISVNLSAKQFGEDDLSAIVERILADTGLDARQLKLEVTESAVLENREAASRVLNRLKTHGVKVSLDDFGTGYSSFSYLHQLPYDTLKIDRSFVSRIGDNGENSEIIHAIIVLAHNLRMDVVAEGVETAAQAAQLKTMWCESAQGFYFARPLPADKATELIAAYPQW
jgi:diguanylate cyclase (GGDEF)-like protein